MAGREFPNNANRSRTMQLKFDSMAGILRTKSSIEPASASVRPHPKSDKARE
jgi:hypothetical protein